MSFPLPRSRWNESEPTGAPGAPGLRVPVELGDMTNEARELVIERLRRRSGISRVMFAPDDEPDAVRFGVGVDAATDEFRASMDDALASVSRDATVGWTATDERELPPPRGSG